MSGYSATEIETAVSGFVKSDVVVTRDVLGPVDMAAKFDEVLQLVSSTLIFDPNAIFYLIFLATNKLNESVEREIEYVDDILQAIEEMGHRTKDVTQTTLLGDAAAALLDVDSILTARDALSQNSYNRYTSAVEQFTDVSLAPNIKRSAEIIRPPQQARADSRKTLRNIAASYEQILETLAQVEVMLDEFKDLNLAIISIQDSVRKVRKDLRALQNTFEDTSTTRDDKIAECRNAYLRITAGKAVLNNYTTVTDPSEPRLVSSGNTKGKAALPDGNYGDLVTAEIYGVRSAPWIIAVGINDELIIQEDLAGSPTTYTLVPPANPSVRGFIGGPYYIHDASKASFLSSNAQNYSIPASPDNGFAITVDGVPFSGSITSGSRTGAQVVTDILAMVDDDTGTILLSTVVSVTYTTGIFIEHLLDGDYSIIIDNTAQYPLPAVSVNDVLGFVVGDADRGLNANNLFELDGLSPRISLNNGASRTRAEISNDINTWAAANFTGEYNAVDDGTYITVSKTKPGGQTLRISADDVGDRDTILNAITVLGFYEGQSDSSESFSAAEAAAIINAEDKIDAFVSRTLFEEGNNGEVTGVTTLELPLNSVESTDHDEDMLTIRSGGNAGDHRIVSIVRTTVDTITVDADTPFISVGINQSWIVLRDLLQIKSKSENLNTKLIISGATANATLGFVVETVVGTTTGFRVAESGSDIDFVRKDVVAGDIVRFDGVSYTVLEISALGKQLELTPQLDTDSANLDFLIVSAAAVAYANFIVGLTAWNSIRSLSNFVENTLELDRVMNPLLSNKRPSASQIGDARTTANELRELLIQSLGSEPGLSDALVGYQVTLVGRIDASLNMLRERGLDRAYDFLMDGKIAAFFGFDKDDAASAAYMLKASRVVVQSDLAISKLDDDADDIIHTDLVVETDADYDFSDADEDEGINLLGELPDAEDAGDEFYKSRY